MFRLLDLVGRSIRVCCVVVLVAACGAGPAAPPSRAGAHRQRARRVGPLDVHERSALQGEALQSVVQAEAFSTRCTVEHDEGACNRARELYTEAADTWNALVVGRPGDAEVVEWTVQRAQALLGAGSLAEAAATARQALATGTDAVWRKAAAEVLVRTRELAIEKAELVVRQAPPEPTGEPPAVRPIDLPLAVAYLRDARERYLELVPEAPDTASARRTYALDNALLLFRYGHWPEARTALQSVFDAGCAGEGAWDGAATAWRALRDMSVALAHFDAVAELGRSLTERGCDFGTAGAPTCDDATDDPRCLARTDAVSVRLRTGILLAQRAEHERAGPERVRLAIRAGEAFLASVDGDSEVPPIERVDGLIFAARAFRLAGSERAIELDRRMATEVVPSRFGPEERPRAVTALADALARLLNVAQGAAQHDEVVLLARRLLGADFDQPELAAARASARAALPSSLVALGKHREASDAWAALAAAETEPARQRSASLASALALVTANDCRRAMVALRAFARAHRGQPGAHDEVVRALYRDAMCQREGSPGRAAALEEMSAAAAETRDSLGAEARGYVSAAAFARADAGFADLARLRITLPRGPNTEALGVALTEEVREPADEVRQLLEAYDAVIRFDDARWSAAAHYRAGLALERLVEIVLTASWSNPADLEEQRRILNQRSYDQLRGIVATRLGTILETQARPFRCRAVERFQRAVALATQSGIQSPELDGARARLAALGDEVMTRCRTQRPGTARPSTPR